MRRSGTCEERGILQVQTPFEDCFASLPQGRGKSRVIVDSVFAASTTQQDFYNTTGLLRPAQYVIDGHEVSIFAYGQTGTGKTRTMEGLAAQAKSAE
ncbi:hypothetical protein V5799_033540 [Amblyomma americanum]|uniref:Kinesin motor domain-containing protein n=1 Tax=Amblyomma americanum TaxID=6943 RepID=A0AAQ4DN13_AMBAM